MELWNYGKKNINKKIMMMKNTTKKTFKIKNISLLVN